MSQLIYSSQQPIEVGAILPFISSSFLTDEETEEWRHYTTFQYHIISKVSNPGNSGSEPFSTKGNLPCPLNKHCLSHSKTWSLDCRTCCIIEKAKSYGTKEHSPAIYSACLMNQKAPTRYGQCTCEFYFLAEERHFQFSKTRLDI